MFRAYEILNRSDQPTWFEVRVAEATLATDAHLDIVTVEGGGRVSIAITVDRGIVVTGRQLVGTRKRTRYGRNKGRKLAQTAHCQKTNRTCISIIRDTLTNVQTDVLHQSAITQGDGQTAGQREKLIGRQRDRKARRHATTPSARPTVEQTDWKTETCYIKTDDTDRHKHTHI